MFTYGNWTVRPVAMTEAGRPVRMGCLPGSDAEHLVVELHGYVKATVSCPRTHGGTRIDLAPLARVLPFDLAELVPA